MTPAQWIDVKQELPPDGQWVLICLIRTQVFVGMHNKKGWSMGLERRIIEGVTHWMPLPEPPEK
jgi:hypothetical protein